MWNGDERREPNGYVKWYQLVTVVVGLLGIVTWGGTQVIAIDLRSNERDRSLQSDLSRLLESNGSAHEQIRIALMQISERQKILLSKLEVNLDGKSAL